LESQALHGAGYQVSVVCPKAPGDPSYQEIDGIHLYKYRAFPPITRQVMFVGEYAYSILATFFGLVKAYRRAPFRTVQVCNPPDVLWGAVLPLMLLLRVRLVYDQHDLCPELYLSRFGAPSRLVLRLLTLAERITYGLATHVIVTNESYRKIAMHRGRKRAREVTIVRTGPDPERLRVVEPDPALRRGFEYLLVYIGVMGPQDGVDVAVRAMHHIVEVLGRRDVGLTLIGDGDVGADLRRLSHELRLDEYVHFTGRAPDELVARLMSTADIGLSPDPKNPLNDVSTMNKTMEYMAFELPVVAFDLVETRVSAGEAACYAEPNRVEDFADTVVWLLDDDVRRKQMGKFGRQRVCDVLAWQHQAGAYVGVHDNLIGR
jgi:asparagine synthase (glutamine-hydrolysing)